MIGIKVQLEKRRLTKEAKVSKNLKFECVLLGRDLRMERSIGCGEGEFYWEGSCGEDGFCWEGS